MHVAPKKELSLFDSTCIIVGIIIGAGIYETAPTVAASVTQWWAVLAIWAVGGLLSMAGSLCYAELASAYPYEGGDYVYLSRAYGRWAGFLFGWIQLTIVRPGDIALMAFIFARYAKVIFDPIFQSSAIGDSSINLVYASVTVSILTVINILGVREGKWTQNILTIVKALGLIIIFTAAIVAPPELEQQSNSEPLGSIPLSLAMILILFTFGGWNEVAYVAAELKNPKRNILRALVIGIVSVTVLYLLANSAFLYALGHSGMASSKAVAVDTIIAAFPKYAGKFIAVIICISTLGAINGLIFTGARISYAVGTEYKGFAVLGRWHQKTGTPIWALLAQGLIAIGMIVLLGSFLDAILYTAAAVYSFYLATCFSVIVLRFKEPNIERPYRLTGYPITTLIFCAVCAFLIYSCISYAVWNKPKSLVLLSATFLIGVPLYWFSRGPRDRLTDQKSRQR